MKALCCCDNPFYQTMTFRSSSSILRCFSSYLWQSQQKNPRTLPIWVIPVMSGGTCLDKEIRIHPKPLGQRYDWKWLEAGLVSLVGFRSKICSDLNTLLWIGSWFIWEASKIEEKWLAFLEAGLSFESSLQRNDKVIPRHLFFRPPQWVTIKTKHTLGP